MLELYILLVFMIIGAVIAIQMKDLLSSVIAVGVVGLFLSVAFLILKAPDLAITQLVVEILILIILIRATISRDISSIDSDKKLSSDSKKPSSWWSLHSFVTLVSIAVFLVIAYICLRDLPRFGFPIMRVAKTYISQGLDKTGATNLVAAVILDYRAYDTLGEATVLFTAVVGVLTVLRRIGRKKVEEADREDG